MRHTVDDDDENDGGDRIDKVQGRICFGWLCQGQVEWGRHEVNYCMIVDGDDPTAPHSSPKATRKAYFAGCNSDNHNNSPQPLCYPSRHLMVAVASLYLTGGHQQPINGRDGGGGGGGGCGDGSGTTTSGFT